MPVKAETWKGSPRRPGLNGALKKQPLTRCLCCVYAESGGSCVLNEAFLTPKAHLHQAGVHLRIQLRHITGEVALCTRMTLLRPKIGVLVLLCPTYCLVGSVSIVLLW